MWILVLNSSFDWHCFLLEIYVGCKWSQLQALTVLTHIVFLPHKTWRVLVCSAQTQSALVKTCEGSLTLGVGLSSNISLSYAWFELRSFCSDEGPQITTLTLTLTPYWKSPRNTVLQHCYEIYDCFDVCLEWKMSKNFLLYSTFSSKESSRMGHVQNKML